VQPLTTLTTATDIADPRVFPERVEAAFALHVERAAASLASSSASGAENCDALVASDMAHALNAGNAMWLAGLLAAAPSAAIARQLWRQLVSAWEQTTHSEQGAVGVTLFAMPIVIVAARADDAAPSRLEGALPDSGRLRAILLEHGALAGNRSFALANGLAASDAIDVPRLPDLLTWTRLPDATGKAPLHAVEPAPIQLIAGEQTVHLRFIVGTALAAPGAPLLADSRVDGWGVPFAQELARQLSPTELTVLALPRAPRSPLLALHEGRTAQREVGAQLFASDAIRRLRASVGEPSAVISAHRCPTALGGGELRLSLSSVFDSRQAKGFRCPLFAPERVGDVAAMLLDLLHDCRVAGVHVLSGVYPDRDPRTGLTLLFKAESLAEAAPTPLQ
jgi:hypothetical protein